MGENITRDKFIERFVKRMVGVVGPTFTDDGESVSDYAHETAPSYWETDWQRDDGPEACADADMGCWDE